MSAFPALLEKEDGSVETIQVERVVTLGATRPVTVWKDTDGNTYVRKSLSEPHLLVPAPDELDPEFKEDDKPSSFEPMGVQEHGGVPRGHGADRTAVNEESQAPAADDDEPEAA